jgi:hypothetical protein
MPLKKDAENCIRSGIGYVEPVNGGDLICCGSAQFVCSTLTIVATMHDIN